MAKSKVDLGKALIRAAEKAAKPEKTETEGESSAAATADPPKKRKKQPERSEFLNMLIIDQSKSFKLGGATALNDLQDIMVKVRCRK